MSCIFRGVKSLEMFNICFPDFWMWIMNITYMYIWGALKNSFSPPEVNAQSFMCQTPGPQHTHQCPGVKMREDF